MEMSDFDHTFLQCLITLCSETLQIIFVHSLCWEDSSFTVLKEFSIWNSELVQARQSVQVGIYYIYHWILGDQ